LLGSLLGCAITFAASLATTPGEKRETPNITATTTARNIAPFALPPRMNYGAPFVRSRVHPVLVAAAIAQFSLFGLLFFPASRPISRSGSRKTSERGV
jgi:hypothetical protein